MQITNKADHSITSGLPSPYYEDGQTAIFHADARQVPLPDQIVHCVVTSPPYFGLRVYKDNDGRGIGLEASVDAYLDSMMEVMAEVWRVLRDDGICWVNLGDSYGGSGKGQNGNGDHAAKHGEKQHTSNGTLTGGLPVSRNMAGQLLGIPWRFALRMQEAGWILRQDVIWAKDAPMPESLAGTRWERCRVKVNGYWGDNHPSKAGHGKARTMPSGTEMEIGITTQAQWSDCPGCPKCEANGGYVLRRGSWRCTEAHEYIFQFVKQMGYWSDGAAVKLPTLSDIGDGRRGNGAGYAFKPTAPVTHMGASASGANRRSVWKDIKPEPYKGGHYATFPTSLPRICIQASTSEAGCCPTCGAQWARVVEHKNMVIKRSSAQEESGIRIMSSGTMESPAETQTTGWRPTCQCPEHQPVPAAVFDPFGGTGTTCIAARRLGRRAIMTDLSENYLKQAVTRLSKESFPLALLW